MPTYECKIRQDKLDEFKKNWGHPHSPEKWVERIEALNDGKAKIKALELFGAPIRDLTPGDFSKVECFSHEWFVCIEVEDN